MWNKGGGVSPEVLTGNQLEHIITKERYKDLHPRGTGLPYVTAVKMKWFNSEMPRVLGIAALVSIFILLLVTRSLRGVVVPLVTEYGLEFIGLDKHRIVFEKVVFPRSGHLEVF